MHEEYLPVIQLSVHLSDQQSVYFVMDMISQQICDQMKTVCSKLMIFFHYNAICSDDL